MRELESQNTGVKSHGLLRIFATERGMVKFFAEHESLSVDSIIAAE
jgi:hypothetical protein